MVIKSFLVLCLFHIFIVWYYWCSFSHDSLGNINSSWSKINFDVWVQNHFSSVQFSHSFFCEEGSAWAVRPGCCYACLYTVSSVFCLLSVIASIIIFITLLPSSRSLRSHLPVFCFQDIIFKNWQFTCCLIFHTLTQCNKIINVIDFTCQWF